MKICIVADEFPRLSETFVSDQALCLRERGHDVEVLCRRRAGGRGAIPEELRAAAPRTRTWWRAASPLDGAVARLPPRWRHRAGAALDLLSARRLSKVDVIVAHFGYEGARVARLMRRVNGLPPLVTIFHGHDVATVPPERIGALYADLFAHGARHLAVNAAFCAALVAAGAPAERMRVHHVGARLDHIPFAPRNRGKGPLNLLSVCRLTEKKGIAYALRALAVMKARRPQHDWRYRIIGDGEGRAELEALGRALRLDDRVTFLGSRPAATVRERLADAEVFLLPSVTARNGDAEGIPVSIMEAMASGALVVSTVHSGIPELVAAGETGLLAPERDVEALADRLIEAADMAPERRAAMARAARRRVEEDFDVMRQTEKLERELAALVRSPAS
ncbi:glycosyltransferase [Salinarimonas sp.]|uniref:glycosyltransferase n=1 Tax=Salinarimonas sp. TaxID=2766526 RepID=UPI0032D980C4